MMTSQTLLLNTFETCFLIITLYWLIWWPHRLYF